MGSEGSFEVIQTPHIYIGGEAGIQEDVICRNIPFRKQKNWMHSSNRKKKSINLIKKYFTYTAILWFNKDRVYIM